MRWLLLIVCLMPLPAFAQDKAQTLADVKAELASLAGQFNALKQELVTSGAATNGAAGGDALQRMDAIEAELTRLTAKTEAVQLKVNAVVADGTNRIGDIEFRLCEMTTGCDTSTLPATPDLGAMAGGATATTPPPVVVPSTDGTVAPNAGNGGAELAVNEKSDFDRAKAVLASGDFRGAATLFETYAQSYPGGPLAQEAGVLRGDALSQAGDTAKAARSYLDAFSGAPEGSMAGQALMKLGQSLGKLGQKPEACVTLAEVGKRFPGTLDDTNARLAAQTLGCT
ncbi:MAG: tol-pal system protein YbgF [Paracoccaceae bacterium]